MQIKYTGYNDGNYEDGSVSIYYGEKEDSLNYDSTNFKTITPGKKFTDYYNYNFGNKKRRLYISSFPHNLI